MNELLKKAIGTRRELHRMPELSLEEFETSKYITNRLDELGIFIEDRFSGTSMVGLIKGEKPGPTVALRADIDALAIEEKNSVDYRSKNLGIMHACGHDGHIAMLLAAAEHIVKNKKSLCGNVKVIFQSAEEKFGGARTLVQEGVLSNPEVDAVFALHLWPDIPKGVLGLKEGCSMASNAKFEINIKGKSAHGAMPHLGSDALLAAAEVVTSLQSIVSRNINPLDPAVLTVGKLSAGTEYNILAADAKLQGTVRAVSSDIEDLIENKMKNMVNGICEARDCKGSVEFIRQYPPTMNSIEVIKDISDIAEKIYGKERILKLDSPYMTAEDFAYYLSGIRDTDLPIKGSTGALVFLGTKDEKYNYPLHHEKFNFDEEVMEIGIKLLVELGMNYLR